MEKYKTRQWMERLKKDYITKSEVNIKTIYNRNIMIKGSITYTTIYDYL